MGCITRSNSMYASGLLKRPALTATATPIITTDAGRSNSSTAPPLKRMPPSVHDTIISTKAMAEGMRISRSTRCVPCEAMARFISHGITTSGCTTAHNPSTTGVMMPRKIWNSLAPVRSSSCMSTYTAGVKATVVTTDRSR
ncbi:hypothetical protein ACLEPN_41810 [Myxococcus sp. 1LA]